MGAPISCRAPRSVGLVTLLRMPLTTSSEKDVLSLRARVVGENTLETASLGWLHPGGGTFFAAAQAVTARVSIWSNVGVDERT
jgi:hypothetical protein